MSASADRPSAAELEAWSLEVAAARAVYEKHPITSHNGVERVADAVPRDQYMLTVRANAALARENRELRAALEAERRKAALAKMRNRPPR